MKKKITKWGDEFKQETLIGSEEYDEGFLLEIRLIGSGVEDAFIKFDRGLNIVSGASDTGKTYVFQCIDI